MRAAELRGLLEVATAGPWELRRDDEECGEFVYDIGVGGLTIARVPEGTRDDGETAMARRDAKLIVALVNAAPVLIECLEALGRLAKARTESDAAYAELPRPGGVNDRVMLADQEEHSAEEALRVLADRLASGAGEDER